MFCFNLPFSHVSLSEIRVIIIMSDLSDTFSNAFGNLEDVDVSDIPDSQTDQDVSNPTMSVDDFKTMAMNMAKKMKPSHAQNLRRQIQTMAIDIGTINMMLQMRQFAALRMFMKGKEDDPNFNNAIQAMMTFITKATPTEQVQIAQLVLSLPVPAYHATAQTFLDNARLASKKPKSAKSARQRARRERIRAERMNRKKKK